MKSLLTACMVVCAVVLTDVWRVCRESELRATTSSILPSPHTDRSVNTHSPAIWTCNTTLYKSETLVLQFNPPNPPFLGVIDPGGHFFYLVFPHELTEETLMPFIESNCFLNLKSMEINTETIQADPYTYGVYVNQPVFIKSGSYTFIMGDNLHIDNPVFLKNVAVVYKHTLRDLQYSLTLAPQ